ncbi:MAG: hypothetical protein Kow00108_23020 [Calditrichia bacterium]
MKNITIQRLRRLIQILALMFILLIPVLNKLDIHYITGTYFSFSFWGFHIVDPSMVLQQLLLENGLSFSAYIGAGIIVVLAIITGRAFCSWICPYFLLRELLNKFRPQPYLQINKNPSRLQFWIIPLIIAIIVFMSKIPVMTYISFPGILSGAIADLILEGIFGIGVFIVVLVVLIELLLNKRFWCKYICPVGATLALFRTNISLSVRYNPSRCNCLGKFSPCNNVCPLHLNPKSDNLYPTCNNCGECIQTCNQFGKALQYQLFRKPTSNNNEIVKREEDVYER